MLISPMRPRKRSQYLAPSSGSRAASTPSMYAWKRAPRCPCRVTSRRPRVAASPWRPGRKARFCWEPSRGRSSAPPTATSRSNRPSPTWEASPANWKPCSPTAISTTSRNGQSALRKNPNRSSVPRPPTSRWARADACRRGHPRGKPWVPQSSPSPGTRGCRVSTPPQTSMATVWPTWSRFPAPGPPRTWWSTAART